MEQELLYESSWALQDFLSKPEGSREVNVWASGRGKIGVMFCFNMWIRSHTLSFSFSLSLTQTHTHTHMHRLTQILAVRHHNYSTNCCPARCRPVRIMSQHTNDSFGLLIMQFLWSAPLAHAKTQSLCGSSWRGESVEIIVCRSSLAALTSGRVPLCGATNRVVLKIPCRCGAKRALHASSRLRCTPPSAQQRPAWLVGRSDGRLEGKAG